MELQEKVRHTILHFSTVHLIIHIFKFFELMPALYRGTSSQILRVAVGSGSQLTSFTYTKRFVNAAMPDSHWFVATATSACVASVFVCVFMSPFDVAATRVYNQPIDSVSY